MTVSIDAARDFTAPDCESSLLALVAADPWTRRAAAQRIDITTSAARQALLRALFHDPDAEVRAAAARRLGRCACDTALVTSWLCDAVLDATPLVREAALRALARQFGSFAQAPEDAAERCRKRLFDDSVWWVRRAAALALFALRGADAIDDLRKALGDPFWRVRHTAVQSLLSLGTADPARRAQILGNAAKLPALVQSGLWYLRARWNKEVEVYAFPSPPIVEEGLQNPDPAVVTARLRAQRPESLDPLELVPLLADPHQPLRRLAVARLAARPSLPALRAALSLLKIPGPPHASEAVNGLLNRLGEPARILCEEVLRTPDPECGALIWASRFAAMSGALELRAAMHAQLGALTNAPTARAAIIESLVALTDHESEPGEIDALIDALCIAQRDADIDVRSSAVIGLSRFFFVVPERIAPSLWTQPLAAYRPLAACALVDVARRLRDVQQLRLALHSHAIPRAQAVDALARLDAISPEECVALREDSDPAVRASVLRCATAEVWLHTLKHDADPLVQRRALSLIVARRRRIDEALLRAAAQHCSASADVWLRVHGCDLLDADHEADREVLLQLIRDPQLSVRAAAASRFEACGDEDLFAARRNQLLEKSAPAASRHVRAMREAIAPSAAPRRQLGATGLQVSPLGLSGAYDPPPSAMMQALQAGVNFVFWEPRYAGLTRFLRRTFAGENKLRVSRENIVVAAGSFEGDRRGIERDLDQALRRLGTDHIDLFLLLWVRSPERLSEEVKQCLRDLKRLGRIRACGFSTHHRDLAEQAVRAEDAADSRVFDVLMLRHSAAHPGAEDRLLPLCAERNIGVITFSTLCYGRLLRDASASECYRYSLAQHGVTACWSAPRSSVELRENLSVLPSLNIPLEADVIDRLRAIGKAVREEDRRFNALLRKGHEGAPEALRAIDLLGRLDAEGAGSDDEPYRGAPGIAQEGAFAEEEALVSAASFHAAMERRGRP